MLLLYPPDIPTSCLSQCFRTLHQSDQSPRINLRLNQCIYRRGCIRVSAADWYQLGNGRIPLDNKLYSKNQNKTDKLQASFEEASMVVPAVQLQNSGIARGRPGRPGRPERPRTLNIAIYVSLAKFGKNRIVAEGSGAMRNNRLASILIPIKLPYG